MGTLKFKTSEFGFEGVEIETNRRLTAEDCTEEFIRGCRAESDSDISSWDDVELEEKKEGYVYGANFENEDSRIIAPYKDLAAELLQRVNDGAFSKKTTYSGKIASTIVTYDLGCSYPNEGDFVVARWEALHGPTPPARAETLRLHGLWVNRPVGSCDPEGKQADLSGQDLSYANLRRADMTDASLTEANLTGALLREAELNGAILTGANLTGADLTGAYLLAANLTGADLSNANLTGASLTGADLSNANMVGANMIGANLSGAILDGANLKGADLTGANLTGAILTDAILPERT